MESDNRISVESVVVANHDSPNKPVGNGGLAVFMEVSHRQIRELRRKAGSRCRWSSTNLEPETSGCEGRGPGLNAPTGQQFHEALRMSTAKLGVYCPEQYQGPSIFHRARVWLGNLWHWRTAWAVRHLSKQLQRDKSFRESWHANIAMPIYDQTRPSSFSVANAIDALNGRQIEGFLPHWVRDIPLDQANAIADRLMKHLFDA